MRAVFFVVILALSFTASAGDLIFGRWSPDSLYETATIRTFASPNVMYRVVQHPDYQLVTIDGAIFQMDQGLVDKMLAVLIRDKRTIVLTKFNGGTIAPVLALAEKFREICPAERGCSFETEVKAGQRCASNCLTLFMAGAKRSAAPEAEFGFHAASNGPQLDVVYGLAQSTYQRAGISVAWIAMHENLFQSLTITWLRADQLNGSGIVTDYLY